jgi:hypothetical protein
MPFRVINRKTGFYLLTMQYQGKELRFIAEWVKFNNLREYWNIHAGKGELISISFHVQTKEIRQDMVWNSKEMPDAFKEALQKEMITRINKDPR